jgi:hypothetical protein
MGDIGDAVSYTVLALGFVLMIFLGALFFVQVARRGNRRFRWWRGPRAQERDTSPPRARNRSDG